MLVFRYFKILASRENYNSSKTNKLFHDLEIAKFVFRLYSIKKYVKRTKGLAKQYSKNFSFWQHCTHNLLYTLGESACPGGQPTGVQPPAIQPCRSTSSCPQEGSRADATHRWWRPSWMVRRVVTWPTGREHRCSSGRPGRWLQWARRAGHTDQVGEVRLPQWRLVCARNTWVPWVHRCWCGKGRRQTHWLWMFRRILRQVVRSWHLYKAFFLGTTMFLLTKAHRNFFKWISGKINVPFLLIWMLPLTGCSCSFSFLRPW